MPPRVRRLHQGRSLRRGVRPLHHRHAPPGRAPRFPHRFHGPLRSRSQRYRRRPRARQRLRLLALSHGSPFSSHPLDRHRSSQPLVPAPRRIRAGLSRLPLPVRLPGHPPFPAPLSRRSFLRRDLFRSPRTSPPREPQLCPLRTRPRPSPSERLQHPRHAGRRRRQRPLRPHPTLHPLRNRLRHDQTRFLPRAQRRRVQQFRLPWPPQILAPPRLSLLRSPRRLSALPSHHERHLVHGLPQERGGPMTATVIHAEALGKNYRRGLQSDPGLRHALENFLRDPVKSLRRAKQETFWALKDVSLDVHEGEVLGLIGRNGAGKTTLLKILSRITKPTTGFAEIHGRVGSLLEVGTGFHPELTGRENTFLSGAILGMSKRDITRKFDEIVAFAELEKSIDTPVKHYSSGMYVRLAFAVAAHLEPEILLVDEVLAVGDINFQKKCLGKMGDVARAGRTVVLVSHQMNQMRRLCDRAIWIDRGHIRMIGSGHDVVSAYESAMARGDQNGHQAEREPTARARFVRWEIDAG